MTMGLRAAADGNSIDILLGATVIATLSANGVEAGGVLLADAAAAQGFANLKKLLTPGTLDSAFKGANQSLGTNSYQKLPGGMILQIGRTTSISAASTQSVTFPIAFPNACVSVVCVRNNSSAATQRSDAVDSYTTSGFVANNGSPGSAAAFSWIAMGY